MKSYFKKLRKKQMDNNRVVEEQKEIEINQKEYEIFKEFVQESLEYINEIEEKLLFLDTLLLILKNDLKYEMMVSLMKTEKFKTKDPGRNAPIPYVKPISKETKMIDLENTCLISFPWERKRFIEAVRHMPVGFKNYPSNHMITYYQDIDLAVAHNGFHSLTVGSILSKGMAEVTCYLMEDVIKEYETDGGYWIKKENLSQWKVFDNRFTFIYFVHACKLTLGQA